MTNRSTNPAFSSTPRCASKRDPSPPRSPRSHPSGRRRGRSALLATTALLWAGTLASAVAQARDAGNAPDARRSGTSLVRIDTPGAPLARFDRSGASLARLDTPRDASTTGAYGAAPPAEGTIYRCGNSYSPRPCGEMAPLDVSDPRTTTQRLQAENVAARDKRLAAWLAAQRREREGEVPEPKKVRKKAVKGCVQTEAVACPTKQPRPRRAIAKAPAKAASAAGAAPGK